MSNEPFLVSSRYIDSDDHRVLTQARSLAHGCRDDIEVVEKCFNFVRDKILHSGDHGKNPVTRTASEALLHRTGFCYSKSHLLVALLRANGIPAGLNYQRLSIGEGGPPYCLHGLVGVRLPNGCTQRIDARGNRTGLFVEFVPLIDCLAFQAGGPGECNLPGVFAEPLPTVMAVLEKYEDVSLVAQNLPDL